MFVKAESLAKKKWGTERTEVQGDEAQGEGGGGKSQTEGG